jgi:hypothetical protein
MRQFEINFEAGLAEQFPEFRDVVKASVYSCGRPFKSVAADLDMSVSELSRKLADNPNDPVHFPLHRLPDLVRATGDRRLIYWLIESFLEDPSHRRQHALAKIEALLPELQALLKTAAEPTQLSVAK